MRLIDVDLYCATICKCNRRACDRAKCPIHNAPTAYSVDKVVEELEERKALHERLVDYETKNGTVTEKYQHIKAIDVLNDAIEIVKQGSVSDDVCEWTKSKDYPFDWFVGCEGCEVNHKQGDYCPICGKKIKVVDQNDNLRR